MSVEKRSVQRVRKRKFDELPPRVIIHDILPFFCLRIDIEEQFDDDDEPFVLFGYFRKDGLRNTWFVFSSVLLSFEEDAFLSYYPVISCVRIVNLELIAPPLQLYKSLITVSPRMKKLVSLDICLYHEVSQIHRDELSIFKHSNGFPNLVTLSLRGIVGEYLISPNSENVKQGENIRSITIENHQLFNISIIPICELLSIRFGNLVELNLLGFGSVGGQHAPEIELNLPKLKKLNLMHCSTFNIVVSRLDHVKTLKLAGISHNSVYQILRKTNTLTHLSLTFHLLGDDASLILIWNILMEKYSCLLQSLDLSNIRSQSRLRSLLETNFERLRYLRLIPSILHEGSVNKFYKSINCPFSITLEELKIENCVHLMGKYKGFYAFFTYNEFPDLKKLSLRQPSVDFDSGEVVICKPMKKLMFLHLSGLVSIDDSFFREGMFPSLEELWMDNCGNEITGSNWGSYVNRIRNLRIDDMDGFTDKLFQEHKMESLRYLWIYGSDKIRGSKWLEDGLKNLKTLKIECSELNSNLRFQKRMEKKVDLEIIKF